MKILSLLFTIYFTSIAIEAVSVRRSILEQWDPFWAFKKNAKCPEAKAALDECPTQVNMKQLKNELRYSETFNCDEWTKLRNCLDLGTQPCQTPTGVKHFFINLSKLHNAALQNVCFSGKDRRTENRPMINNRFLHRNIAKLNSYAQRQSDDNEETQCSGLGVWFMYGCID